IIAKVEGEYINEDKVFYKREYASEREKVDRTLNVSLLGFFKGNQFERGIKELPLIDSECILLHKKEFDQVHNFIRPGDEPITIGTLSLEKGQEIQVGINSLFASHIGIFGNTGSGKSYTLARLYRELFEKYKDSAGFKQRAEFFLIDFNGEYVDEEDNVIIDKQYKRIFKLSTSQPGGGDRFPVTKENLSDPNFWVIFLDATEKTQTPFLRRSVGSAFLAQRVGDEDRFKILLSDLILDSLTKGDRNLDKGTVTNMLSELRNCLNGNDSVAALVNDFQTNLKYHNRDNTFYYESGNQRVYSAQPNFKADVI